MAVIAIDGPAGAGKSSVSREVAEKLGFQYLDTGAMYRCAGLAAQRARLDLADREALASLLAELSIAFQGERVLLNGEDVSTEIRTPAMDKAASEISAIPMVRERLTELQRSLGRNSNIVAEGRDMGTVVFPDAELKIFLTASTEARARRRWNQLKESGQEIPLEKLVEEIEARDRADSSRACAPLKPAPDAIIIDTTHMTRQEVVEAILTLARKHVPGSVTQ